MKNSFWKRYTNLLTAIVFAIICTACGKNEEEQSALDKVKYENGTYAYQEGKVYYRRYHEDSYEDAALWGNYDAVPGTKKEIVCIDGDGTETVLFDDYGYGDIYLLAGRFYMQEKEINNADNVMNTRLYSVDIQGNDRIDYGYGDIIAIDRELNIIVLKIWEEDNPCYYVMNYESGEKKLILSGLGADDSIGAYQNGWLYYIKHDWQTGISAVCAVSTGGEDREIISIKSPDIDLNSQRYVCNMEVDKDRIYFVFGNYGGSANVFQGGKLISIRLDGTDYKEVDTDRDVFYLCHDNGKTLIYFPRYYEHREAEDEYNTLIWDVDADICYPSDFPPDMMAAYRRNIYNNIATRGSKYYLSDGLLYFMNRRVFVDVAVYENEAESRTDIYAIADDSGEIIRVVTDIGQFYTKWEKEEAETEYIDEHIYYGDFYFADGFLYFKAEYRVHDKETSIGWRDGWRRLHTEVYRLKIGEDRAEILYSY